MYDALHTYLCVCTTRNQKQGFVAAFENVEHTYMSVSTKFMGLHLCSVTQKAHTPLIAQSLELRIHGLYAHTSLQHHCCTDLAICNNFTHNLLRSFHHTLMVKRRLSIH